MSEMLAFFQTVHQNVWGGSIFEWLFYISVLFILVFEKRREVKIIFALYSIAFHIIVYNPLNYRRIIAACLKWFRSYFVLPKV